MNLFQFDLSSLASLVIVKTRQSSTRNDVFHDNRRSWNGPFASGSPRHVRRRHYCLILWIGLSFKVFGQHIRRQWSVTENLYMTIIRYKNTFFIFYNIFFLFFHKIISFKIIVNALLSTFYIKRKTFINIWNQSYFLP